MESFAHSVAVGEINILTGVTWLLAAFLLAAGAGAVSALKFAGKDVGNELAAMMGAMFGPIGAVPGVIVALIVLRFI